MFTKRTPLTAISALILALLLAVAPIAAQQSPTRHTVQRGETLANIGAHYGVSWADIAAANGITNPNRILAGQVLVIPAHGGNVITTPTLNYTIHYGDTLSTIALKYNTTVAEIVAVNDITAGSRIYPNQVIRVPVHQVVVPTPTPLPVPVAPRPQPTTHYYAVQPGDTMFRIASHFGVNVYDLAEVNSILNLNLIYVGQWLTIPRR